MTDTKTCSLCGTEFDEWGNNPDPLADLEIDGPCCNNCNASKVVPARLEAIPVVRAAYDAAFGRGKSNPALGVDE